MKKKIYLTFAAILAAIPFASHADVFFNDTFGSGSTLTNATPANPTANSTAYQLLSARAWAGQSLTANDLRIGMVATGSGILEVQALFSTNPITLTADGDYIRMTVTFTNTAGLLTSGNTTLDFGLFNSGGLNGSVKPVTNGLNGTLVGTSTTAVTGAAQNWLGYLGQILYNGGSSRIMNRNAQTGANNQNQGTVGSGTSSGPANPAPATVGSTTTSTTTLTVGATYTDALTITRNSSGNLLITNTFYAGPDTNGSVLANFGGVTTGSTYLTSGFDSLSIGYRCSVATTMDISSIKVEGSVTTISTPPTITAQPVSVNVATNGSCPFVVSATGVNVTYQWCRNGTNLLNGGNISGATSSMLVINNASVADELSGANGYYCVVTGAGNLSTNSTTNSLTLVPAKNLVWNGAGTDWDLNTSLNWNDPVNPATFNYGDSVTFDDTGAANANVTLTGNFLSASQWLITGGTAYAFGGTGSFAGTGPLILNSGASGSIQFNNVTNIHTGGTIVSNSNPALTVYVGKYQTLGSSTLTLATPGIMEFAVAGSATLGVPGDVVVNDDFTLQFDGTGVFAGVILGNLSGASGKTLTLTPQSTASGSRYRVYGTNMVYNGNLMLNGASTPQALYGGTVFAPYNSVGSQTYNGVISGNGGLIERGSTTILNGQNTYVGGTFTSAGSIAFGTDSTPTSGTVTSGPIGTGALFVAPEQGSANGSGTVLAYGGARTIANPVQYPSATNTQTLIIGGTNQLTFSGPVDLQGQDATGTQNNRTFQVANTAPTIFAGVVGDNGSGFGLTKTGAGALYLNNAANTYTGVTTNSAGLLAGSGSLAGSVVVQTNASIGGGSAAAIGTLTVSGDLTFENGGGGFFRVNRSGFVSDEVSVAGTLAGSGAGRITVTNLGSTLQLGDTFTLFNKAVTGGNTLVVTGAVSAGLTWTNKLAVDGTIQVVQGFATYATNISYSVSGSTLTITWPATHQGWFLQAQTNSLSAGLGTNWVTIPGTDATTTTNLLIVPGNPSVFYRLKMP